MTNQTMGKTTNRRKQIQQVILRKIKLKVKRKTIKLIKMKRQKIRKKQAKKKRRILLKK